MSINGLEKITEKILSEANEKAEQILVAAEAESKKIADSYAERAEEIRERISSAAERDGKDMVSRAKSSAATAKRNAMLTARAELIDGVFDGALATALALPQAEYIDLLTGLLCAALTEQLEAEYNSRTLYGEEEAMEPEVYEVLMNARDRERCGAAVVAGATKKLSGKVAADRLQKLKLSDKTVSIDGGLILRYGDIESNCSFSLLFAQLREELETEVSHCLFDARTKA